MKPGVVGFCKRTDPFAVGAAETIKIIAFFGMDVPFVGARII
jgi:hypothetical protein